MHPESTARHQDIAGQIYLCPSGFAERTGAGRATIAPVDVHLGAATSCGRTSSSSPPSTWEGSEIGSEAPRTFVEVISPLHAGRDRLVKRSLHARNGIHAYWIADPTDCTIEVPSFEGDVYGPERYFQDEETLTSPRFPGLRMPLPTVFGST